MFAPLLRPGSGCSVGLGQLEFPWCGCRDALLGGHTGLCFRQGDVVPQGVLSAPLTTQFRHPGLFSHPGVCFTGWGGWRGYSTLHLSSRRGKGPAPAHLPCSCPPVLALKSPFFSFFSFFWPKLKAEASGHLQGRTWGWAGVTVRGQLCRKVLGPAGYPGAPRAPQARLEGSGLEMGLEQPNCRKFCAGSGPNGPSRVLGSCFSGCHL